MTTTHPSIWTTNLAPARAQTDDAFPASATPPESGSDVEEMSRDDGHLDTDGTATADTGQAGGATTTGTGQAASSRVASPEYSETSGDESVEAEQPVRELDGRAAGRARLKGLEEHLVEADEAGMVRWRKIAGYVLAQAVLGCEETADLSAWSGEVEAIHETLGRWDRAAAAAEAVEEAGQVMEQAKTAADAAEAREQRLLTAYWEEVEQARDYVRTGLLGRFGNPGADSGAGAGTATPAGSPTEADETGDSTANSESTDAAGATDVAATTVAGGDGAATGQVVKSSVVVASAGERFANRVTGLLDKLVCPACRRPVTTPVSTVCRSGVHVRPAVPSYTCLPGSKASPPVREYFLAELAETVAPVTCAGPLWRVTCEVTSVFRATSRPEPRENTATTPNGGDAAGSMVGAPEGGCVTRRVGPRSGERLFDPDTMRLSTGGTTTVDSGHSAAVDGPVENSDAHLATTGGVGGGTASSWTVHKPSRTTTRSGDRHSAAIDSWHVPADESLVEAVICLQVEAEILLRTAEMNIHAAIHTTDQARTALKTATETVQEAVQTADEATAALPEAGVREFPAANATQSLSTWVKEHVGVLDYTTLAATLYLTEGRTRRVVREAVTVVYGLPEFFARARAGEFRLSHVECAGQLCKNLPAGVLARVDRFLAQRRALVSLETFRKSLQELIDSFQTVEDKAEVACEQRRLDFMVNRDGSATVAITGELTRVYAAYRRWDGLARAIHRGLDMFDEVPEGRRIAEDRTLEQLRADVALDSFPEATIRTIPTNVPEVEETTASCGVSTAEAERVVDSPGSVTAPNAADEAGAAGEDRGDAGDAGGVRFVTVRLPDSDRFLARQAQVSVTVPALTLLGQAELPGRLPDGSPVPAETARLLASGCGTWTRILTDPATGTPLDARARRYAIPDEVRVGVGARWGMCTVPGCTRAAYRCEIDHVEPFCQADPGRGGLTVFGNLHPLCKMHHQAKTDGVLGVAAEASGARVFELAYGRSVDVFPPEHPGEVRHAFAMLSPDFLGLDTDNDENPGQGTVPGNDTDADPTTSTDPTTDTDLATGTATEPAPESDADIVVSPGGGTDTRVKGTSVPTDGTSGSTDGPGGAHAATGASIDGTRVSLDGASGSARGPGGANEATGASTVGSGSATGRGGDVVGGTRGPADGTSGSVGGASVSTDGTVNQARTADDAGTTSGTADEASSASGTTSSAGADADAEFGVRGLPHWSWGPPPDDAGRSQYWDDESPPF
ncbi:hypothetical protein [Brevibacterium litoralis]|uniref:hypothetical protein n=1 Tax=Brevibacterium litoralis TaxID=3138935 RepID=UPI0032EAD230